MADGKVLLEVVVEGKNVKVVQREVEQVTNAVNENTKAQQRNTRVASQNAQATDQVARSHEHYDRGLKGVHQGNLAGAKSFSKMRDVIGGSSGLVGAYATLAANLFAATAAFGAFQKAAGVEQLAAGLEALGRSTGVAMTYTAQGLQKATGYAVSFQDAMKSTAMITSAGFSSKEVERFGRAARDTSIALGRDLQDSLDRITRGIIKLEPELLDELGIMTRIDEATQKYAESIGKSKDQLTPFEKRLGFMNAALQEATDKFGAIGDSVDVNPYDKLSASLQELMTTFLNFGNMLLGPIAGALSESKLAITSLFAIFGGSIAKQAFPFLAQQSKAAADNAKRLSEQAKFARQSSQEKLNAFKQELPMFDKSKTKWKEQYNEIVKNASGMTDVKAATGEYKKALDLVNASIDRRSKLPNANQEELEALKQQRDLLTEMISVEKERTGMKGMKDPAILDAEAAMAEGTASILESLEDNPSLENFKEKFGEAIELGSQFREKVGGALEESKKKAADMARATYGPNGPTGAMQKMQAAGVRAGQAIARGFTAAKAAVLSLGPAIKVVGAAINTMIPIIGQVMFFWSILTAAFEKADEIFSSKERKNFKKWKEETKQAFEDITKNLDEASKAMKGQSAAIVGPAALAVQQANNLKELSGQMTSAFNISKAANNFEVAVDIANKSLESSITLREEFIKQSGGITFDEMVAKDGEEKAVKFFNRVVSGAADSANKLMEMKLAADNFNTALTKYFESARSKDPLADVIKNRDDLIEKFKVIEDSSTKGGVLGTKGEEMRVFADAVGTLAANFLGIQEQVAKIKQLGTDLSSLENFSGQLESIANQYDELSQNASNLQLATGVPLPAFPDYSPQALEEQKKAFDEYRKTLPEDSEVRISLNKIDLQTIKTSEKLYSSINETITEIDNSLGLIADQARIAVLNNDALVDGLRKQLVEVLNLDIAYQGIVQNNKARLLITEANAAAEQKALQEFNKANKEKLIKEVEFNKRLVAAAEAAAGGDEQDTDVITTRTKLKQSEYALDQAAIKEATDLRMEGYRLQEASVKLLEEEQKGSRELYSILQQNLETRKSYLEAIDEGARIQEKLNSLREGGTGEVSALRERQILQSSLEERKKAMDDEYNIKVQMIQMDAAMNKAKLILLQKELEAKRDEQRDISTSLLANTEERNAAAVRAEVLSRAVTDIDVVINGGITAAGITVQSLDTIVGEATDLAHRNKLNAQNSADAAIASIKIEKEVAKNLLDVNEEWNNTISALEGLIGKMIDARSSIIDSEMTIEANRIKAMNRKSKQEGLTPKQEYDLNLKYLKRRKAIIDEETSSKIELIKAEYRLLEAKTRLDQLLTRERMKALTREAEDMPQSTNLERQNRSQRLADIGLANTAIENAYNNLISLVSGGEASPAAKLLIRAAQMAGRAAKSDLEDQVGTLSLAAEDEDKKGAERKKKIREQELEILRFRLEIEEKIIELRKSAIDDEKSAVENTIRLQNLQNKGRGTSELTATQSADIEIKYQQEKKQLILDEKDIKMQTIEAEYDLMEAQLRVRQWMLEKDLEAVKLKAEVEGDTTVLNKANELIANLEGITTREIAKIPRLKAQAIRALNAEYASQLTEAELAIAQATEAAYGWMDNNIVSWEAISTAIGDTFNNTVQQSKEISIELAGIFTNALDTAANAFVDAIVEGKNILEGIGNAVRDSLREGLAGLAKNKIKEGIAGIGSGLLGKLGDIMPGMKGSKLGEDFSKMLQGPQERAALAAESTNTGIVESNRLLTQIEINTRTSSMPIPTAAPDPYAIPGGFSPKPGITDTRGNPIVGLSKKDNLLLSGTSDASMKTAEKTAEGNWLTETWGKAQTYATENVGTIAAAGFASIVTAIAAGRSTKSSILGGVLGIAGSVVGGMFGGPAGAAAGGQIGAMIGARGFSDGGVMSSSGPMPLQKYANGGIARTPQLAMFGEGSKPEAYVPLPDGRSIPVTMASGGGNVNNISVNVAVDNKGGAQTQTQTNDNTEEYSRRLGTAISNAVKQEIFNQQRPGGLLYKGRR